MPQSNSPTTIILSVIDQCPPFLLYYLSHYGRGKHIPVHELSKSVGMPHRTFIRIADQKTWARVKVGSMEQFCEACGMNPMHTEVVLSYLGTELAKEVPFDCFPVRARGHMVRRLNKFCSQSILAGWPTE